jgi:DNA primase
MLDGDPAGQSASRQIADTLNQYTPTPVHRIELPPGLDPDDLYDSELARRLLPFPR